MKAELEKQLSALSTDEKNEIFAYLMPFVTEDRDEETESPELIAELERRLAADKANPEAAISLEEFNQRWKHLG